MVSLQGSNSKIITAEMLYDFVCFAVDSRRRRCHFHHHRRHFTLLDNEKQTAETSLLHKA